MGMIEDVLAALDRLPLWKRLRETPDRVERLEARVAALEAKLSGKPGMLCPVCNAPAFARVASKPDPTFGDLGVKLDSYRCSECGHAENRQRDERAR